jgi:hypothetical protein
MYTIDFTPKNQEHLSTQLQMLYFMNVPAEIRLRQLKNIDFTNDEKIVESWIEETNRSINYPITNIKDRKIRDIVKKIVMEWKHEMNLYTHNCQHFSHYFMTKMIEQR